MCKTTIAESLNFFFNEVRKYTHVTHERIRYKCDCERSMAIRIMNTELWTPNTYECISIVGYSQRLQRFTHSLLGSSLSHAFTVVSSVDFDFQGFVNRYLQCSPHSYLKFDFLSDSKQRQIWIMQIENLWFWNSKTQTDRCIQTFLRYFELSSFSNSSLKRASFRSRTIEYARHKYLGVIAFSGNTDFDWLFF